MRVGSSMPRWVLCALALASLQPRTELEAQATRRQLVGIVRDAAGAAIEGATVEIRGSATRTDEKGTFLLWTGTIDTITLAVRRLGFGAVSALLTTRDKQWDTVVVEMERTLQFLSGVKVAAAPTRRALALREFDERRAKGNGVFVTREEIVERNTSRLSDILRTKRGVNVVRLRSGYYGVRFVSYMGKGSATCAPDIWLDGQRARGMEIDDLIAHDVEALELYQNWSTAPFEFSSQSPNSVPCGVIVIWTRVPASKAP